ncbi:MAG TPA: Hsp20/alpha crystallin family protein [Flavipsychrobacter sp.]|nr:Hsp20/alpha crystallin family protein [Flavipsychrobacter sp.]
MPKTIGGLIEDVFQNGFQSVFGDENWSDGTTAPANIQETENSYEMQLMAPGLKKEDFKINVDRNVLHVSYEHKEEKETTGKWLRKEYRMQTFRRSFTLNDKINVSGIAAKYADGILNVSLPKKEVTAPESQEISVN